MNNFLDFIIMPGEAVYRLSRRCPGYTEGLVILVLASFSIIAGPVIFFELPYAISSYLITWGTLFRLLFLISGIFILTVFYHYFAGIFGGAGDGVKLLKGLFYSMIPFCFITPVTLILKMFEGKYTILCFFIALILLLCWSVYIQYRILNYFYGISSEKAISVMIIPWVAGSLVVFTAFVIFLMSLVSLMV
ncbi:YIP1 family protein [Elusimicrobiota bacterium]